jgi:hypothetical protein
MMLIFALNVISFLASAGDDAAAGVEGVVLLLLLLVIGLAFYFQP